MCALYSKIIVVGIATSNSIYIHTYEYKIAIYINPAQLVKLNSSMKPSVLVLVKEN